jgi:hypothetical protein
VCDVGHGEIYFAAKPLKDLLYFTSNAIAQHLDHKAKDTYTQTHRKEREGRLHVIQVETVISIKRVNDSYLLGFYFMVIHDQ